MSAALRPSIISNRDLKPNATQKFRFQVKAGRRELLISAAYAEERNEWVAAIEQTINSMKRDDKSRAFTKAGMLWRLNSHGVWKQRCDPHLLPPAVSLFLTPCLLLSCSSWFVLTIEGISFWSEKNGMLKQKLTFAGNLVSVELVSENVGVGSAGIAYQFRVHVGRDYLVLAGDTMQVTPASVRSGVRPILLSL